MANILVTGGAGFIGSHLTSDLVARGHDVRVLDSFITGRKENLSDCLKHIELTHGDIRDMRKLRAAMHGISRVFHLAAVSSVPQSVDDPLTTADVNVQGTWNVLEAARRAGVERVIFVTSASVYGESRKIPFKETMQLRGSSPYASSKLIGEQLCDLYRRLYGMDTVALRLFSVYGPRQNPRSQYANVIPAFATRLLRGERPTIYGDGSQTRDFVFVGDVVRAFREASRRKKVVGEVINVGSGVQLSIRDLLYHIAAALGVEPNPVYRPLKPGDDPRTLADPTKCRELLGIRKATPFATGLRTTLLWFERYVREEASAGGKRKR